MQERPEQAHNENNRLRRRLSLATLTGALAALLVACGTSGADLEITSTEHLDVEYTIEGLERTYHPGDSGQVDITIKLTTSSQSQSLPRNAVAFLNIVEAESGDYDQAAHEIIAHASPRPMIFRTPRPGRLYAGDGLTTTLTFRIKEDAGSGRYFLALQLFAGTNTNPHRVDTELLIGDVGGQIFWIE